MTCNGLCIRYKAVGKIHGGRYANGQKRCQTCNIFLNWDGLFCPCCGYRVRGKPRRLKWKEKLREKMTGDALYQ